MPTELFMRNGLEVLSVPLRDGVRPSLAKIETSVLDGINVPVDGFSEPKRPVTLAMEVNLARDALQAIRELKATPTPCLIGLSDSDKRPQVSTRGNWKLPKERTTLSFVAVVKNVDRYHLALTVIENRDTHWGRR